MPRGLRPRHLLYKSKKMKWAVLTVVCPSVMERGKRLIISRLRKLRKINRHNATRSHLEKQNSGFSKPNYFRSLAITQSLLNPSRAFILSRCEGTAFSTPEEPSSSGEAGEPSPEGRTVCEVWEADCSRPAPSDDKPSCRLSLSRPRLEPGMLWRQAWEWILIGLIWL